jgi:hypothetical protein
LRSEDCRATCASRRALGLFSCLLAVNARECGALSEVGEGGPVVDEEEEDGTRAGPAERACPVDIGVQLGGDL